MSVQLGVTRSVIRFEPGNLDISYDTIETRAGTYAIADFAEDDPPFDLVVYTLDANRLRDLLNAAAAGTPADEILLALDAAALVSEDFDEG